MAALFAWLTLIGGILVAAACIIYPREIGKESRPIIDLKDADIPPLSEVLARMRSPKAHGTASRSPTATASALDARDAAPQQGAIEVAGTSRPEKAGAAPEQAGSNGSFPSS